MDLTPRDELIDQLIVNGYETRLWPTIKRYDAWKKNARAQVLLKEQYLRDQKKLLAECKIIQSGCLHPLTRVERADTYEPMTTWCLICGAEL